MFNLLLSRLLPDYCKIYKLPLSNVLLSHISWSLLHLQCSTLPLIMLYFLLAFIFVCFNFIWKEKSDREREIERCIFHLLVDSSNSHKYKTWTSLKPGAWVSNGVSHIKCGDPALELSPRAHISKKWWSQNSLQTLCYGIQVSQAGT